MNQYHRSDSLCDLSSIFLSSTVLKQQQQHVKDIVWAFVCLSHQNCIERGREREDSHDFEGNAVLQESKRQVEHEKADTVE